MHKRRMLGARLAAGASALALTMAGALGPGSAAHADPVQDKQWYLTPLRVKQAQQLSTGKGVVVAVIDTGVQADHPDLAGQVLPGIRWPPDSNPQDQGRRDVDGHGTIVAGIIAAKGGAKHVLGVAPGVKILPVALGTDWPTSYLGPAMIWAVDHGAKVINISLTTPGHPESLDDAVRYAAAHDVVVVASAGNTADQPDVREPAARPGVVAVSGLDEQGDFWSGSVSGSQVAISAPASNIFGLATAQIDGSPGGYGRSTGGTSASAPMVAAAAAMIRAKYPALSAPDVINRLIRTADDAGQPGRDPQYGFGKLDIVKALTADVPSVGQANPLGTQTASPTPQADGIGDRLGKLPVVAIAAGGGLVLLVIVAVVVAVVLSGRRRAGSR